MEQYIEHFDIQRHSKSSEVDFLSLRVALSCAAWLHSWLHGDKTSPKVLWHFPSLRPGKRCVNNQSPTCPPQFHIPVSQLSPPPSQPQQTSSLSSVLLRACLTGGLRWGGRSEGGKGIGETRWQTWKVVRQKETLLHPDTVGHNTPALSYTCTK